MNPVCDYCGRPAELVPDSEVYRSSYGSSVWLCRPCGAWVGIHRQSKNAQPLGRLANKELRALKIQVHALFDPFWSAPIKHRGWSKSKARGMAYKWLASKMGIPAKDCHVGMFSCEQCQQAIEILQAQYKSKVGA